MLNIVVPLAGKGQRFVDAGYSVPKPLIPVHSVPMIELVIANLRPEMPHRFIFIARADHLHDKDLTSLLRRVAPGSITIPVFEITEGPACSVLLAKDYINDENPLMIANCDQWIDIDINDYISSSLAPGVDGMIMTMKADSPKWSYARTDERGWVTRTAEKIVISHDATVGIYNFTTGRDFVSAAKRMIDKNLRVNNEFYVAPAYNELIAMGKRFGIYDIGEEFDGMYGLGTPEDLTKFLAIPLSFQAAAEYEAEQRVMS